MLEKNFQYKINKHGAPQGCRPLTADLERFFVENFPASYVDFVRAHGLGGYFDNGYQFVDPREYNALAALIFKADSDFSHKNSFIVAFTAFGELVVWSQNYFVTDVSCHIPGGSMAVS